MRKRGLLSDEEFLKLRDALNFYLLVRDRFHSIKDTIQPAEPEGLALAELLETHRKDTVAPSVMPALARDLGFTDEQALSNALDRHSNNVLGIYNDIQKRLLDELRQNKRYGPDWVGAFSKASDVAAAEREHEEIFSAYENSGEQGKPILFALAWHSRHPKVLEKLYTYYNRTNYLYVAYGLSDNRSTPKNIVEELYAKIGDEYLQVRHRAEENLKDKAAIKSASVGSERKIVNAYQPAKATEALPLEDRIAAAISAAA
jgi:hypothetical protein